jgi:hypothetical protein
MLSHACGGGYNFNRTSTVSYNTSLMEQVNRRLRRIEPTLCSLKPVRYFFYLQLFIYHLNILNQKSLPPMA